MEYLRRGLMANSKKKKKDNRITFHCPYCRYSERSVRAKKFTFCPQCGKELKNDH